MIPEQDLRAEAAKIIHSLLQQDTCEKEEMLEETMNPTRAPSDLDR